MVNLNSKKAEHILLYLIGIMVVVVLNQAFAFVQFRIDLTEEKRYTISDATINLLEGLENEIFVEVYLEGDLPAGFKRLNKSIRETLQEFKIHAGENLNFRFTDPASASSEKARNEFYISLGKKGIQPTRLFDNENGKRIEKIILPGAVVSYGGRETGVMLLKGNRARGAQESLNQSIENVEYELASAIRKLTQRESKKVGLLKGHGQPDSLKVAGLKNVLSQYYTVHEVNLKTRTTLTGFDAIVLNQPREEFSEEDVYKIDQFLMKGGVGVFMVDIVSVDATNVSGEGTVGIPVELGLDNLFFKYGIRFNRDLILDLSAGVFPVVVGNIGDQPQVRLMPWPFYPELNHYGEHVIVKNMDATLARFVSTIDTVKSEGILKTPLIFTSEKTRIMKAPVPISLNDLRDELKPEFFNSGHLAVAWLLEGNFTSVFKNRMLPKGVDRGNFIEDGKASKIVVVSDGDFAMNDINNKNGQPYELGYDSYSEKNYANADFVVNTLTYLLDEHGIITARKKEIKIRPLDKVKIQEEKTFWKIFNLATPIALIIIFGVLKGIVRKRKYAAFKAQER